MAVRAGAGIGAPNPRPVFLVAAAAAVDRDGNRDRALLLHAQNMVLGDFEFVGGVKLRPDRPAARRNDIGNRCRRLGREDHQVIADLRRPRYALLAIRMIGPVLAGRRDDDRRLVFLAENFRGHVDLADIDQPPRPQLEFQEAVAVGAERNVVVDSGRQITKMSGRHVLVHHRFEIKYVERVFRARDQVLVIARRPYERIRRPLRVGAFLG